jgi:hypothetical protein
MKGRVIAPKVTVSKKARRDFMIRLFKSEFT